MIKGKIYRNFTQQQSNNYTDILADLQKGYNLSQHRGLCNNTPNAVDEMIDKNEIEKQRNCQMRQKMTNFGLLKNLTGKLCSVRARYSNQEH